MFQEKAMHYKEKKRSKTIVLLLTVDVCICVCILLAVWAVFLKEPQAVALAPESASSEMAVAPDVAPTEVEPNQTPLMEQVAGSATNDNSTGENVAEEPEDKNRVSLSFAKDVTISLTNKTATLYLGSGERSLVDVVVQIIAEEQILAQSGRITPGNKVEQLSLVEGVTKFLNEGSYEGALLLHYYDPETGEKSQMVNNIPVTVIVQN